MNRPFLLFVISGLTSLVIACEDKKPAAPGQFTSTQKEPEAQEAWPEPFPEEPATDGDDASSEDDTEDDGLEGPGCDEDNDAVELEFADEEAQDCVDGGFLWNFDKEECSDMPKATSFECTYEGLTGYMKYLGIEDDGPDAKKKKKAKLVGCGLSENGMTILAQYWFPPKSGDDFNCKFSKSQQIDVGCYKGFGAEIGGSAISGSATDAESAVASCYEGG